MTNTFVKPDWDSDWVDEHRRGINDVAWARMQPDGPPNYRIGDVVEFMVGGFGVIDKVNEPLNGWPSSYSTDSYESLPPHATHKCAWHYEGDFKRLVGRMKLEWLDERH